MSILKLKRLTIMPTLKCTLKCKLCSNYMTMFHNETHVPIHELQSDISHIFNIVDYTEWLQFVGGEIFMRRDMAAVYEYCLRFKSQFNKLILITNATVMPCVEDIRVLQLFGNNIQIQISDYGKLSYNLDNMTREFAQNNIPYVIKKYHGEMQHYSGWVNNNNFENRGKDSFSLREQFESCGQVKMENMHLYRGKIHGCARSLMASTLGKIIPAERDFVDIYSTTLTAAEKKEKIRQFNDIPRESCKSCVSFAENTERFPAAEQIDV